MTRRARLSATVERELLEAGEAAVQQGAATSLSAWVNEALRRHVERERQLAQLNDFLDEYEAEAGEITEQEMEAAHDRARARALVVRPVAPPA